MKNELPQFLRDIIASPPAHGSGVHQWLFKVARQLHAHRDHADIVDLLAAAADGCGRHVPISEIEAAVADAAKVAWQPNGTASPTAKPVPKWPEVDQARRAAAIASSTVQNLADLWEASPVRCVADEIPADWIIDQLFPGNPLLCVGLDMATFTTAPREDFRGKLGKQSLIVPSPMSALTGKRKSDGQRSGHTLDNTGPRSFLVTEFDTGTADDQAALLWHLSGFAPLVMVLWSGSKSYHGWFNCHGATDEAIARFFRYAVSIGADPATWTRSQFVRLPQGWRADKGKPQSVYYFDNSKLGGDEG